MRSAVIISLLVLSGGGASAAPALENSHYHIVFARRAVRAGEHVELKLVPPVPPGYRIAWSAGMRNSSASIIWRAPFQIAPGTPPVTVGAGVTGPEGRTSVSAVIELSPGSVAGAEDCLGPGQSFSTTSGTILPDYLPVDELPELLQRVPAEYPRGASSRGIDQSITVTMLVCRNGRVLDAYSPPFVRDDLEPIEQDPALVEAAIAAARQFVFKPALVGGQPVATWVTSHVRFSP